MKSIFHVLRKDKKQNNKINHKNNTHASREKEERNREELAWLKIKIMRVDAMVNSSLELMNG